MDQFAISCNFIIVSCIVNCMKESVIFFASVTARFSSISFRIFGWHQQHQRPLSTYFFGLLLFSLVNLYNSILINGKINSMNSMPFRCFPVYEKSIEYNSMIMCLTHATQNEEYSTIFSLFSLASMIFLCNNHIQLLIAVAQKRHLFWVLDNVFPFHISLCVCVCVCVASKKYLHMS